jgi:hypothetical protein
MVEKKIEEIWIGATYIGTDAYCISPRFEFSLHLEALENAQSGFEPGRKQSHCFLEGAKLLR